MKRWRTNINLLIRSKTIYIVLASLFSCSGVSNKNNQQEHKKSEVMRTVYKKPPSSFNDTLIIRGKSAIFYNSDSAQLEKTKAIIQKNEYESEVHNCFYLMRNARIVLKKYWPQIQITETSKARYLLFIKADKSKVCIDLNTKYDQCGIFLFDPRKAPELVDMMNIDTALGFYFDK